LDFLEFTSLDTICQQLVDAVNVERTVGCVDFDLPGSDYVRLSLGVLYATVRTTGLSERFGLTMFSRA
jgi:hypothetical protein